MKETSLSRVYWGACVLGKLGTQPESIYPCIVFLSRARLLSQRKGIFMRKLSSLHTNNALAPLPELPEEKKEAPTITAAPSKGQQSNPLKYSDVSAEVKQRFRKLSTKDLGRMLERAGGATTPKGRIYAAVLEERSVNPLLASKNPELARKTPYSVYKTAQYNEALNLLEKVSNPSINPMQNPKNLFGAPPPDMTQVDNKVAKGMGGAVAGGLMGGVGGMLVPGKGRLKRGIIGLGAGTVLGGAYGLTRGANKPKSM